MTTIEKVIEQLENRYYGTEVQNKYVSESRDSEIYETDDAVVLNIDLPGFEKDSINVSMEQGTVSIVAEKEEYPDRNYIVKNSRENSCNKEYRLPAELSTGEIYASYDNGVLCIIIEKEEAAKPKKIEVQ